MATTVPATPQDISPITGRAENDIDKVFRQLIKHGGSDLHMQVGKAPILRVKGTLRELQMEPITKDQMMALFTPMMDERNTKIFHDEGGADFSYVVEHDGEPWRFRVNLFIQSGFPAWFPVKLNVRSPTLKACIYPK